MLFRFLVLIAFMSATSCNNSDNHNKPYHEIQVDNYNISIEDTSKMSWHCFNVNQNSIYCPESWEYIDRNDCLFFSQIDDTNSSTYFVVVRNKNKSYDKYFFKELYNVLKNDTVELVKEFKFTKLNFINKTTYYAEFTTLIDNVTYVTFSSFIKVNRINYDISLKVLLNDRDKYYKQYQSILYNYKVNQENLYSIKDKLRSFEEIDLSKY